MSYADAAASHIPTGEMPEPSQDLRDGVGAGPDPDQYKEDQARVEKDVKDAANKAEKKGREYAKKARHELDEAETTAAAYWEKTKEVILRPSTLGGLMGVVNVGLLGGLGLIAYQNKDRPWDQRYVAGAVGGTLALFGMQGLVTESYLQTPEGQAEKERAKREGSKIYLQAKEVILRPGVAGGLVGIFNIAVLGTVGYFANKHWNDRVWDRKIVGGIAAGLMALSGLEGVLGQQYVDKELPKH